MSHLIHECVGFILIPILCNICSFFEQIMSDLNSGKIRAKKLKALAFDFSVVDKKGFPSVNASNFAGNTCYSDLTALLKDNKYKNTGKFPVSKSSNAVPLISFEEATMADKSAELESKSGDELDTTEVATCSQVSSDGVSLKAGSDFNTTSEISPVKNKSDIESSLDHGSDHEAETTESHDSKTVKRQAATNAAKKIATKKARSEPKSEALKSLIDEEKALRREVKFRESEISQAQKLQSTIDSLRAKVEKLQKKQEGTVSKLFSDTNLALSDDDLDDASPTSDLTANNVQSRTLSKSKVKSKIAVACETALKLSGLSGVVKTSDFIADLLARADKRSKENADTPVPHKPLVYSSSSEDSSDNDDDDDHYRAGRGKKSKKKLKSGMNDKPKNSGIRIKLKWATSMLGSKADVSFDDLTFDQYIQGETQILNKPKISDEESKTRIYLMKRISKLNEKLPFAKSKELYRETLLAIEKGEFSWLNFYEIERIENDIRFSNMKVADSPDHKAKKSDEVRWCKDYNAGKCTFSSHHNAKFNGKSMKMWHICRVCWSKNKDKKFHKAGAEDCPSASKQE